jgi:hypothetical protein
MDVVQFSGGVNAITVNGNGGDTFHLVCIGN